MLAQILKSVGSIFNQLSEGNTMSNKTKKTTEVEPEVKPIIAKRDFIICQNAEYYDIKEGDDILELKVPERFHINLKTEQVI